MYNEVYDHYGDDVYKLGYAKDIKKRLVAYTTGYLNGSEIKLKIKIHNREMAEYILFDMLEDSRLRKNREFFKIKLEDIKKTFDIIKSYDEKDLMKIAINIQFDVIY